MSSQELPQSQRQELESGTSIKTTMQLAEAPPSEETATQEAEPKQEVPSSEPAIPSSDAILPSSPSPAKHLPYATETSNVETSSRKRPADSLDSTSNPDNNAPTPNPAPAHPTDNANPTLPPLHQKLSHLQSHLTHLQHLHQTHLTTHSTLPSGLPLPTNWTPTQIQASALETAHAVIKEHIALLHGYNEIKDVGMGLLGLVAEKRGVRVRCVMEEFGVGVGD